MLDNYSDTKYHAQRAEALFNNNPDGYARKVLDYPLFFWISDLAGYICRNIVSPHP